MLERELGALSLIVSLSSLSSADQVRTGFVNGINALLEHTSAGLQLTPLPGCETIEICSESRSFGEVYLHQTQTVHSADISSFVRRAAEALTCLNINLPTLCPDSAISDREDELRRLNRQLRMLSEANQIVVHAASEAQLLDDICRVIVEVGGHKLAWVAFVDDGQEKKVSIVAKQGLAPENAHDIAITWDDSEWGAGPSGTAIRTGQTYVCANAQTDSRYSPWRKMACEYGYLGVVALPLKSDRTTYGALSIYSHEEGDFSAEEMQLLEELAGDLAYGINTLRAEAKRRRAEDALRLNEARLETLLDLSQMHNASLQEIADFALDEAIKLTNSTMGYLAFMNEDETSLHMFSWSENAIRQCSIRNAPLDYPIHDTGLWGEAVRRRKPIVTNDYSAPNPHKKGLPAGHVPLTRHFSAPVFEGNRIVLVAGVGNKAEPYDESDVRQLVLLMDGMWKIIRRHKAEEERRSFEKQLEAQKRQFYRSTILSVTEAKLDICEAEDVRPYISQADLKLWVNEPSAVSVVRHRVEDYIAERGIDGDRLEAFMTGVGEALANAVKHARHGLCRVGGDDECVWVAVSDRGSGIDSLILPRATLQRGFSTKPSMGLGYSIMLDVSDRILLKTSGRGTTVVLVKRFKEPAALSSTVELPDTWEGVPG